MFFNFVANFIEKFLWENVFFLILVMWLFREAKIRFLAAILKPYRFLFLFIYLFIYLFCWNMVIISVLV